MKAFRSLQKRYLNMLGYTEEDIPVLEAIVADCKKSIQRELMSPTGKPIGVRFSVRMLRDKMIKAERKLSLLKSR